MRPNDSFTQSQNREKNSPLSLDPPMVIVQGIFYRLYYNWTVNVYVVCSTLSVRSYSISAIYALANFQRNSHLNQLLFRWLLLLSISPVYPLPKAIFICLFFSSSSFTCLSSTFSKLLNLLVLASYFYFNLYHFKLIFKLIFQSFFHITFR